MRTKFGTLYTSNITPDPTTGIGEWTEAEFTAALREGKDRHGQPLYPAMPYPSFTKITDADAHALWSYFKTVKPLKDKTRSNAMTFPFNVRTGVLAWQAVFFKAGRYVPDAGETPQWNRGAYLVRGLGHCGACHSPKNFAMAEKKGHALQGAEINDWFAPDISGGRYSGIGDWSEAQVATYLRTGHNEKNVAAVGPMLQTIAQGTQKLAPSDLAAIAHYLKHQASQGESARPGASYAWSDQRRAAGQSVYAGNCEQCHGADGKGADGVAPALAGNSAVTSKGPETVVHALLQGFAPQGRWGAMPSFAEALDADQVSDVANYVRTAWGAGNGVANATPVMAHDLRVNGVAAAPGVQPALICPPVPSASLDPDTIRDVRALAAAPAKANAAAPTLLRDYRARHPDVRPSDSVTVLSGVYCRDVMATAPGKYGDKQQRFVEFMASVSSAVAMADNKPARGKAAGTAASR